MSGIILIWSWSAVFLCIFVVLCTLSSWITRTVSELTYSFHQEQNREWNENSSSCLSDVCRWVLPHLLHIWTSVSIENSRSVSRRWCMWDHRNSGIRNIVERGAEPLPSLVVWSEELPAAAAAADDVDVVVVVDWTWTCTESSVKMRQGLWGVRNRGQKVLF